MCKERTSLKKSQRTHSKREHLLQTNKEYKYKFSIIGENKKNLNKTRQINQIRPPPLPNKTYQQIKEFLEYVLEPCVVL